MPCYVILSSARPTVQVVDSVTARHAHELANGGCLATLSSIND